MGVIVVNERNVLPCHGLHRLHDEDCFYCGYKTINKMKRLRKPIWFLNNRVNDYDEEPYQCPLSPIVMDKNEEFQTFLHYSDPSANEERTVFGSPKRNLFYNYSDRLSGERWETGWKLAMKQAKPKTAKFYELVLKHFHDSDDLDLQHVILGCNMSNGYSYLIFGYIYKSKSGK